MLVFTAYLLNMVFTVDSLPCSCGGVISSMSFDQHIVFNAGFIVLAVIGLVLYKPKQSIDKILNFSNSTKKMKKIILGFAIVAMAAAPSTVTMKTPNTYTGDRKSTR